MKSIRSYRQNVTDQILGELTISPSHHSNDVNLISFQISVKVSFLVDRYIDRGNIFINIFKT